MRPRCQKWMSELLRLVSWEVLLTYFMAPCCLPANPGCLDVYEDFSRARLLDRSFFQFYAVVSGDLERRISISLQVGDIGCSRLFAVKTDGLSVIQNH